MSQYLLLLLFATLISSAQGKVNCAKQRKSPCPQSTFTTVEEDNVWKCPKNWLKTSFKSERWNNTLKPVDTSNLTAEVTFENNVTSISLCTVTPATKIGAKTERWPNGGYCIPSPTKTKCPEPNMIRVTATVTANGRNFNCSDMQKEPSPMSNCGNGTFDINACCPKRMDTDHEYLNVPMYDIAAFYLLKTNSTCPKLYSYASTEESVFIDRATISKGPGQYFANVTNGTLKITFCRYTKVVCEKKKPQTGFESLVIEDQCGRYEQHYCIGPKYKAQPGNVTSAYKIYCLPDGKYNKDYYYKDYFCGAQCPAPPTIGNGTIAPLTNESLSEVTVKCNDGYYVDGPSKSLCQQNGTWSVDLSNTTCKYAECKKSDLPKRGGTKWSSDSTDNPFAYGHNVTFYCSKAAPPQCYYLGVVDKNVTVTCQADGTWDKNPLPRCKVGKSCTTPNNTATATHSKILNKLRCESTVEYTCNPHRLSLTDKLTLTCRADGTFDADPPNCETAFCDDPALNITNGEVERVKVNGTVAGKFLENDTLRYECDPEYTLVGDDVIVCGSDGNWNGTTDSHCKLIVCPMAPLKIPHGHRIDNLQNQTVYHLGDEVEYQCEQGDEYELNYTDPISCSNDGNWNPYIPSCNLVSCETPPHVEHSIPSTGPFPLHSNYTYTCDRGYSLSSPAGDTGVLKCEIVGGVLGWQGKTPTCDLVYCGRLPAIEHGNYSRTVNSSVEKYPYNTQYKYTCVQGYNASVSYFTNCSETGQWDPAPGCHPVQCRRPDVAYSVVNDSRSLFAYHSVVHIQCDDSRVYQPPQDLLCAEDGIWKVLTQAENTEIIFCHGIPVTEPIHKHENKWTFVGVGLAMFLVLVLLLIVFVIKRRRRDRMLTMYSDKQRFSVNRAYRADDDELNDQELTGFANPTYEDNEPEAFRIDRTASKNGRLVLRGENANEPQQYDTLRGVRQGGGGGGGVIEEPSEGQYNTLNQMKTSFKQLKEQELICDAEDDPEDLYNVPTMSRTGTANNHYTTQPSLPLEDVVISPGSDYGEDEDVYNVPTIGRGQKLNNQVEVNDLYNSVEAAQICGTPLETEFDNIIYDNI